MSFLKSGFWRAWTSKDLGSDITITSHMMAVEATVALRVAA